MPPGRVHGRRRGRPLTLCVCLGSASLVASGALAQTALTLPPIAQGPCDPASTIDCCSDVRADGPARTNHLSDAPYKFLVMVSDVEDIGAPSTSDGLNPVASHATLVAPTPTASLGSSTVDDGSPSSPERLDPVSTGDRGGDPAAPTPIDYLTQPPTDTLPTQVGVAGPNGAMDEFDLAFGRKQSYTDLRNLQDRIESMERPLLNLDGSRSTQSDKLDISEIELSQDLFFHSGRDRLRLAYQFIDYAPKTGPDVLQHALGGNGTYRINDWSAVTGDFWVNALSTRNAPDQVIPTYDLFLTLWPNDVIRIDLDANRKIFDNVQSLLLGITADSFAASLDYSPSSDMRLSLRFNGSFYSDRNERQFAELEGVWRLRNNPVVQIGFRASGFQFSKRLNDGYFNPDAYEAAEGMFRLQSTLTGKLDLELAASAGAEHAQPGGIKPVVRTSLQLSYKVNKDWTLDGGLAYFSSRDTNSSGFARTTLSVGLHRRF